jgi:glutamine amidotransferase
MCELLGMSSDFPATLNLSLATLATHGAPPASIRDGWGVAYYEGSDVRLIKDAGPVSDSDWLGFLRKHDLRSPIIMAHIRKATMGQRTYWNAQPFARELVGKMHLFAHNGWLPGILGSARFQSSRYFRVGETDSEQAFCALLDRMADIWRQPGEIPPLAARLAIVSSFADELRNLGPANFLYSDGDALFAHGDRRKQTATGSVAPPGLYMLQNWCRQTASGLEASGVSVKDASQAVTIVASVPLTADGWSPLAEGEVLAIFKGGVVLPNPASAPGAAGPG